MLIRSPLKDKDGRNVRDEEGESIYVERDFPLLDQDLTGLIDTLGEDYVTKAVHEKIRPAADALSSRLHFDQRMTEEQKEEAVRSWVPTVRHRRDPRERTLESILSMSEEDQEAILKRINAEKRRRTQAAREEAA